MTAARSYGKIALLALGCVLALYGALLASGSPPAQTIKDFFMGSLGSAPALSDTLRETTPLLILGVGVYLALRAGLFNIGIEGQFLMGAVACTAVALRFPGPLGIVLGTIAGVVAGGLWALPAGLIKALKGGHEVITTIMLNNVARYLCAWLVAGPLIAPNADSPTTAELPASTHLPHLVGTDTLRISSALLIGLLLTIGLTYWLKRRVAGYELQAVGANPTAAAFAGIDTKKVTIWAMTASGAIGGLAGAFQVLAFEHRFYDGFSPGYGFTALGVALLAAASPVLLIPAALFFGILSKGGAFIATFGVPRGITDVVLGLLILIAAAIRYRKERSHA